MTCRNCGVDLSAEFCGACGQRAIDPDPTVRAFLHEWAEQFLQWDGRLATTFRLLVARPGELTTEYLAGRRIRYLSPLRLYLVCSVLFFFFSALVPTPQFAIRQGARQSPGGPISMGEQDSIETMAVLDSLAQHGPWVGRVWGANFGEAMKRRGELGSAVTANIPRTMFVLVPVFAALVGLAYRSRRRRYPQHLAFALHVHAFLYLALTLMLVRHLTTNEVVATVIALPPMALVAMYFLRSLRHVYGGSRRTTLLRAGTIASTYFIAFLFAMVVTFGLIVLVQF